MNKISLDKQYRTRDGREVRIYAVDAVGKHPVVGIVRALADDDDPDRWDAETWSATGRYYYPGDDREESLLDLIEARPRIKRTVWLNVYRDNDTPTVTVHFKEEQGRCGGLRRDALLARVKVEIDVEEGHGL